MDMFAMIKAQMGQTVPFANHTGVTVEEVAAGRGAAALEQRHETSNHIGSQHAGALFTLGEAASGAAMAGGFADLLLSIRPVAAKAEISYLKVAKGRITALAQITGDLPTIRATLETDGKVQFPIEVALTDASGVEVAAMRVEWHVRKS